MSGSGSTNEGSLAGILIVDDHAIMRSGLRRILDEHSFTDVHEAGNGLDALALLSQFLPEIVILDIGLPGMRGFELAHEILTRYSRVKIIFLTMYKEAEYVSRAMSMGVAGYVLKDCVDSELIAAVRAVRLGRTYLTPMISGEILQMHSHKFGGSRSMFSSLTNREREVLTFVADGKSNKEIAGMLYISPRTVEHHRQNLMRKMDVSSVPELIKVALRNKLISL